MFHFANRIDLSQISLTGTRAIVILGLLMIKPRSFKEIKKLLLEFNLFDGKNSDDVIRIDISTLKAIGCDISRASKKTDYKYVLGKNPFGLKITQEEIAAVKKVYSNVKENSDIKTLIEFHNLFEKIADYVCNEEISEALLGVSVFKSFKTNFIKMLMLDCRKKHELELLYKTPQSKNETVKKIITQQLVLKNDKLYLYGYDLNKKASTVLNISRILQIFSRKKSDKNIETKTVKVRFYLENSYIEKLEENEIIIESDEKRSLIEGDYHNNFLAVQRILSFSKYCEVISPESVRTDVIVKLRKMREMYE